MKNPGRQARPLLSALSEWSTGWKTEIEAYRTLFLVVGAPLLLCDLAFSGQNLGMVTLFPAGVFLFLGLDLALSPFERLVDPFVGEAPLVSILWLLSQMTGAASSLGVVLVLLSTPA